HHLKLAASKPSATNGPLSASSSIGTVATTTSPTFNATSGSAPIPNRSALFGSNTTTTAAAATSSVLMGNGSVPTMASIPVAPKPVPNYGKPNLAPKPPGMQLGGTAGDGGSTTRPTVSRHQSMRSPRSPPVSQTAPAFPANHFGTMRGPPSSAAMFQSSESIVRPVREVTGRPSAPPPKPPTMKPPPPPPVRSVSNTNLTHLPPSLSVAPSSLDTTGTSSPATEPTSFGSVNNVSSLTLADELRAKVSNAANLSVAGSSANSISTGNLSVLGGGSTLTKGGSLKTTAAPPLPPHRTSPAPPPPVLATTILQKKPQIPQESSKIESSSSSTVTTGTSAKMPLPEIDLESKYAFYFHKVTEFPQPIPFLNVPKIYQSELRQQQQSAQGAQQQPHRQ
uniref:WH2 domain-containing protein n=1 Tax=Anopheles maculatus TaxID=74869 RepID=A0A182SUS1_9DIPT